MVRAKKQTRAGRGVDAEFGVTDFVFFPFLAAAAARVMRYKAKVVNSSPVFRIYDGKCGKRATVGRL